MKIVSCASSIIQSEVFQKHDFSFSIPLSFIYLVLLIGFYLFAFRAPFAYAQCNVFCQHERGEVAYTYGNSIAENERYYLPGSSYEVALEDSGLDETDAVNDNLLLAADDGSADTTYLGSPSKKWRFAITPYLWMMGLNGKVGVRGQTADLNVSFSDVIKNLDIGAEVHIEAWRDRFGFFIDATYSKISLKEDVKLRFDREINIKNVTEFFLGEFAGFYRVGTWPISGAGSYEGKTKSSLTVDLIGGGRYWWMDNEIDIKGPLELLKPQFSGSKSWFDFIVGGRAKLDINKFFVVLRTDIGGFGLGFSSDISWNIAGNIGYELPWYHITPIIGYRALYDRYDSGSGDNRFLWDAWMYGPQLGVAFQF